MYFTLGLSLVYIVLAFTCFVLGYISHKKTKLPKFKEGDYLIPKYKRMQELDIVILAVQGDKYLYSYMYDDTISEFKDSVRCVVIETNYKKLEIK